MKLLTIYNLLESAFRAGSDTRFLIPNTEKDLNYIRGSFDEYCELAGRVCVIRSYTDIEEEIFLEGDWDTPELGYMFESQVLAMLPTEEEFFTIKNYRFESDGIIYRAFPI